MTRAFQDIGDFIFVEDAPVKSDAIFVVGGSQPEAAELAADLWKQGYAPRICIGGGVSVKTGKFPGPKSKQDIYCKDYATEYEFYQDVLTINDVPEDAIFGEDRSGFTRQNALFAREAVEQSKIPVNTALLVCKAFHARRCLMFYQSAFPAVEFRVVPFAGFDVTRDNWFLSEYGIKRVLGELKRCGDQITPEDIQQFSTNQ